MQGVIGPGFWNVEEARVLVAENRVVPQIGHPQNHQQRCHTETIEKKAAVAVGADTFMVLKHHHGNHGEESKEEDFGDLSLSDQVPVRQEGEYVRNYF